MILFQELLFFTGLIRLLHLQQGGIINAEVCDRLGGKGTFNSISRVQSNGFHCMNEFYNAEPEATWCSTYQHRQTCHNPEIVALKRCLNSTQLVDFEILGKIDADLVTFVCNNQDIIANYEEDLTKQCSSVLDKMPLRCLNLRSEDARDMDFLEFIHKKIGPIKIDEAEICIRDTLSEHCSDGVSDIMVSILKILQNNASLVKTKTLIRSKRSLRRVVRQLAMNDKFGKLEGHAKNLCIKNGHLSQKLEDTLEKMKTCLREKPVFSIPKHEYIAHVDACTKEAIALFKSCLPEKYKYIPQLLFDIYDAMIGFLYDDFILIGTVLNECLPKLRSEESHKKYEACIEKVEDGSDEELVDSKEKFCKKFEALNECFLTEVKTECKASADLTKFEKDFKEAFTRPCKTTK